MDKRYQVFVSSTYADLREERQHVIQALMEMDCIPSGMELFPAADEEQWEFIKKIINDCDYYLLIIGGRYGSTTPEGISYTEKEYDYAYEKGMKVIALLHENPDEIPMGKSELDPVLRERLRVFREKVAANRIVKFWKKAEELPGVVALSLSKTIKTYPAIGWVRADRIPSSDVLTELNELRKENDKLKSELSQIEKSETPSIPNLASLNDIFEIRGTYWSASYASYQECRTKKTWTEIFALVAPYLMKYPNDNSAKDTMSKAIFPQYPTVHINDQDYETIKIQFIALKLADVKYLKTVTGGMDFFWSLTSSGQTLMMELRAIRSAN